MRLHQDPRAPNPRRVRIYLAEKGLADQVTLVEVPLATRANEEPAFLARNPIGLVPVLELDDGRHLRESMAIIRYLEELHPDPPLWGTDAWSRATIEMWNRTAELEVLFPVAQVFRNSHAFWQGRLRQAPEFADIMREHTLKRMAWLDRELADRPYLAGDAFSVADITLLCGLDFGKVSNLRVGDETPNLLRWHREVSARPSARA
jgi:glutathione S-transferase